MSKTEKTMLELTKGYTRCPYGDGPLAFVRDTDDATLYDCRTCGYRVVRKVDGTEPEIPEDLPDEAPEAGDDYDAADKMADYLWDGTVDGEVYDGDPADLDFF